MLVAIALTCTQWDRRLPCNRTEFIGLAGKGYLELCDSNLAEPSPRTDIPADRHYLLKRVIQD